MHRPSPSIVQAARAAEVRVSAAPSVDRVTQDSADSFPASDPPSWTPLRVGSPDPEPADRPTGA
jgi:hypothetical protein